MRSGSFLVVLTVVIVTSASSALGPPSARARSATGEAALVAPPVLRGSGARVLTIRLPSSRPLIVTATHRGSANFIVHLVGPTEEYLFNEIGRYAGQTLVDQPHAGRYRVAVEADGAWTLKFAQPSASSGAVKVPGTVRSKGARVVQIRATRSMQPIVAATHAGRANFIVHLVGIGKTSGTEFLFNEIGRYRGETLVRSMPRGSYLLAVQADGAWTIKFTP